MPSVYCYCIEEAFWDKVYSDLFTLTTGIDVWHIPISSNLQLINRFDTVLSNDEHDRSVRYHQEKDSQRFIVSRIALRFLLAKYSNNEPQKIRFVEGPNKKPFVQNSGAADLHYNVSHSGNRILVAISNSDVGTDVEKIDEDFSYTEILQQNFSRKEIEFIRNGKHPAHNFYLLWTRKEALLKATSKGIDSDLPFVPGLDGEHIVDREMTGSDENFCIGSFKIENNYVGSIAYKKGCQPIRFRDINEFSFPQ